MPGTGIRPNAPHCCKTHRAADSVLDPSVHSDKVPRAPKIDVDSIDNARLAGFVSQNSRFDLELRAALNGSHFGLKTISEY
jgi:hypothetical protein